MSRLLLETDGENLAEGFRHHIRAVRVVGVNENRTPARHNVDQTPKAGLDLVQVWKDIGVIKLNVIDDDGLGKVMKEFGALVEKSRVVLISFENEVV